MKLENKPIFKLVPSEDNVVARIKNDKMYFKDKKGKFNIIIPIIGRKKLEKMREISAPLRNLYISNEN